MKYIAGTRGSYKDIKAGDKNRKNYPIQIKLLQETDRVILYVLLQEPNHMWHLVLFTCFWS